LWIAAKSTETVTEDVPGNELTLTLTDRAVQHQGAKNETVLVTVARRAIKRAF
jgi:hypothetical protein